MKSAVANAGSDIDLSSRGVMGRDVGGLGNESLFPTILSLPSSNDCQSGNISFSSSSPIAFNEASSGSGVTGLEGGASRI